MNKIDGSFWCYLPYPVLYTIFEYLNYKDLVAAGQVCKLWYEVAQDDLLWKKRFFENFITFKNTPLMPGNHMEKIISNTIYMVFIFI